MNMGVLLTEKIGPRLGKHTRPVLGTKPESATDMHLYLKEQLGHVLDSWRI